MNDILRFVVSIARDVREWAESKAYHIDQRENTDLCGWCAIATAELHRRLCKNQIYSEIHVSENEDYSHAFLVVEDHVVDVTATQFTAFVEQPVVVIHHKEADHHEWYISAYSFDSANSFRKWQISTKWPKCQVAYSR